MHVNDGTAHDVIFKSRMRAPRCQPASMPLFNDIRTALAGQESHLVPSDTN